ncbi:opacity protein-like surface antigen [Bradyrhizobium sp. GM24.11]
MARTVGQYTLAQQSSGVSAQAEQARMGWVAGVGAEFPISGHWIGKVEYLYTD